MHFRRNIVSEISDLGGGLEIGPGRHPIAPLRMGYPVDTLDYRDNCEDRSSANGEAQRLTYLWSGEPYADLTKGKKYDWIIASHVIEHMPDLIGFLNNCSDILQPDGVLFLLIPDKRFCFDYFRSVSSLAEVFDAHSSPANSPSLGKALEQILYAADMDGSIAWNAAFPREPMLSNRIDAALERLKSADHRVSTEEDVHSWVFVPHSFRLLVEDLHAMQLINLRECAFHSTIGCEFYMKLSRSGAGPGLSRQRLLSELEAELRFEKVPRASYRDALIRLRALYHGWKTKNNQDIKPRI